MNLVKLSSFRHVIFLASTNETNQKAQNTKSTVKKPADVCQLGDVDRHHALLEETIC